MSKLHSALEALRPKDFSEVPVDDLKAFLPELLSKAELIANSVPPPPNGTPYELSRRSRTDANGATSAADLTISQVRRPAPAAEHAELQKAWGKPLKMSAKENATGISVFKMAGHDRHGAWFARTSVHEGLGFAKWKRSMQREFPESLAVEGGPGEGNVRGIGGDKRLEDISVDGIGKMEVYQLSAQFPGPTAPREFITLLITSENALGEASNVGSTLPRHYIVVSIPVTHPDAPPRQGLVRGTYESVEMIREIPLAPSKSSSTSDLLKHERKKSRERGGTIGFAESRGPEAKGEKIDRVGATEEDDPETNPVEWIMITRSDPGGGIPRFMVERGTPSSIVADAGKFLNWACAKDDFPPRENDEALAEDSARRSLETERRFSTTESNGILAGVGSSIADRPIPATFRQQSHNREHPEPSLINSITETVGAYVPDSLNPLRRTDSISSSISTASSTDSFASAEQFNTASGLPVDDSLSLHSEKSESEFGGLTRKTHTSRELSKIESKKQHLKDKLEQAREKQGKNSQEADLKSTKELEKATERYNRAHKKQEDKYAREVRKLEQRRKRETEKLLARQQKEADKNTLQKVQRERNEWKEKAEIAEREKTLLNEQIGILQRENTALVARIGKTDTGLDLLKKVKEDLEGQGRVRATSRASAESGTSRRSGKKSETSGEGHVVVPKEVEPWKGVEGAGT